MTQDTRSLSHLESKIRISSRFRSMFSRMADRQTPTRQRHKALHHPRSPPIFGIAQQPGAVARVNFWLLGSSWGSSHPFLFGTQRHVKEFGTFHRSRRLSRLSTRLCHVWPCLTAICPLPPKTHRLPLRIFAAL